MSTTAYELLHYRGDRTADLTEGQLLGADEIGRPWAVIDTEYQPEVDTTTVFLQGATPQQALDDAHRQIAEAQAHGRFLAPFRQA